MRKIYVDGFNFLASFIDIGGNFWHLDVMLKRTTEFCLICKRQNIFLKVFFDGGYQSSEAIDKYKTRCEKHIKNAERRIPFGAGALLGDCFTKNGVEVLYSLGDNDDIMAYYAYVDRAEIISRDKDFWRYIPALPGILKEFHLVNGRINFDK